MDKVVKMAQENRKTIKINGLNFILNSKIVPLEKLIKTFVYIAICKLKKQKRE
jgi:hypothetical protein